MKRCIITLVCAFAVLFSLSPVEASIRFCIDFETAYVDNGTDLGCSGNCEDVWLTNPPSGRSLTGALAKVTKAGSTVFFGYLDDSSSWDGCTPVLNPATDTGTYTFKVYTVGRVNSHTLTSRTNTGAVTSLTWNTYVSSSGTYQTVASTTSSQTQDLFDVYTAAARALRVRSGTLTNETVSFWTGPAAPAGGNGCLDCFDFTTGWIVLDSTGDIPHRKFAITHELGHKMLFSLTGGTSSPNNCSGANISPCNTAPGITHAMGSKEFQRCAATEGFSHYYAAATFNYVSQTNCRFNHWGTGGDFMNCEGGGPFVNRHMEVTCGGALNGYGSEVDWFKMFWDVETNSGGADFDEVCDWIEAAGSRLNSDVDWYEELDVEAATIGGSLETAWDNASGFNGIDHPDGP